MNKEVRCAIYTRKSNEDGLEQEINSLEAQRLAGESHILSHQQEGWKIVSKRYDDGGYSGKNLKRPALQELFKDIKGGEIDCVVVYKIDRLSRVLFDFAKVVEILDGNKATFVVVTQPINTTTSMGRLILNVLLSFAQFEREITIDRVKDKIAISKEKGLRMGGSPPLGYDIQEKKLIVNKVEAKVIEHMFERFIALKSLTALARELNSHGYRTKRFQAKSGRMHGGEEFKKATLRRMVTNPIYAGKIRHHDKHYKGQHEGIIVEEIWNKVQGLIESRPLRIARYQDALLKSVIRCQICNVSMTPTHTKKKNRLYRYYVCSNHLRGKHCSSINQTVAAGEVENHLIKQIRNTFEHYTVGNLKQLNEMWENLFPVKQEEIIKKLIKTVWIRENGIEVCIEPKGLEKVCSEYGV